MGDGYVGNEIKNISEEIITETEKVIIGKNQQLKMIVSALFAQGHILLEDMPGVGKTTLIKTLSKALGFDYKRIQFTSDLLPSDVIGMNIFDRNTNEFRFVKGPVHTDILLADEINRAIPRTQSALLESMEEKQVTVDGESMPLSKTFFVMATENPVETESTFNLPAAQLDRFLIKLSLGYPDYDEEMLIINTHEKNDKNIEIKRVTSPEEFLRLQKKVRETKIDDSLKEYIVRIVQSTRSDPRLKHGASPRATLALVNISKAYAAISGRDFVTPDDIKICAYPVLGHRVVLNSTARIAGDDEQDCIMDILSEISIPPVREKMLEG